MPKNLKVSFTNPISGAPANGYRLRYREYGTGGPYTDVLFPAGSTSPLIVPNVDETKDYEGVLECQCFPNYFSSPAAWDWLRRAWVEDTFTCEQDAVFTETGQVTGLSTPYTLMYDAPTGRVYGTDGDSVNGCFFWYNPSFTSAAEVTYRQAILQAGAQKYMYTHVADPVNRRLFVAGKDSDGVQVYDIATDAVQVIPWGCNHNVNPICGTTTVRNGYPRSFMQMIGNTIIGIDKYSNTMLNLDPATLASSTKDITTIPNYQNCLIGSPCITKVGNEFWVLASQANSSEAPNHDSTLRRYNSDWTQVLGTIDLAAHSKTWSYGSYYRTAFFDDQYNVFYIFDASTSKMIVIDVATYTIKSVRQFSIRQGKTNASMGFTTDPISGELYLTGPFLNYVNDPSPINITYKIDRATQNITNMYPGVYFSNLTRIGLTNELHGASAGQPGWGGNTGWNTDGIIRKFTK